ncbi:MAG: tetratricopeptide repeat protein [Chloroflexi bacterium]|nr:MAG: tetratricopeptide repeat protein [Chloroflexota bacterium]
MPGDGPNKGWQSADWFRDPAWDRTTRDQFEERLNRARIGNRAQYLRIKALAFRDAGELHGAKELLNRVVSDYPESMDCGLCLELAGDVGREEGSAEVAEANYREVIRRWPDLNGTTGMVEVSLAEVLTKSTAPDRHEEALRLLDSALKRGRMMNSDLFRWNIALARVAKQLGDAETVSRAARAALSLTKLGPQYPRHPIVGLARPDAATLAWLEKAAAG